MACCMTRLNAAPTLTRTGLSDWRASSCGVTLLRLAVHRRPRRLPALAGGDGVEPTGHVVDPADGPIYRSLEDLVTGGREQLPTGGTQCLRTCALRTPGDSLGRGAARAGGGRGHRSPLSYGPPSGYHRYGTATRRTHALRTQQDVSSCRSTLVRMAPPGRDRVYRPAFSTISHHRSGGGRRLPSGPRSMFRSSGRSPKYSRSSSIASSRRMRPSPSRSTVSSGRSPASTPADRLPLHQLTQEFHDGQDQAAKITPHRLRLGVDAGGQSAHSSTSVATELISARNEI